MGSFYYVGPFSVCFGVFFSTQASLLGREGERVHLFLIGAGSRGVGANARAGSGVSGGGGVGGRGCGGRGGHGRDGRAKVEAAAAEPELPTPAAALVCSLDNDCASLVISVAYQI